MMTKPLRVVDDKLTTHGFQKSAPHVMQHQPSAKILEAAITLKLDAFLIQNLSLRDSIAGSKFK